MVARIVLVSTSSSYRAGDFLTAADRLGVDVTLACEHTTVFDGAADHLHIELSLPGDAVTTILDYASGVRVDAVVAADDRAAAVAARAARALGLRHNDPRAVDVASDKYRTRVALARAARPTPRFERVSLEQDLNTAARRLDYPVVVKPLHLCASQGVIRADDADGFVAACRRIERILAAVDRRTSRWHRRSVVVEDYIPGHEVALEGLLVDGRLTTLALFDKPDASSGPYFEETVYVAPSALEPAAQRAIAREVGLAAAALGLRNGPLHAECRINRDGVWPIEIAPRSIGGLCSRSLAFVPGLSLEALIVRHALGMPSDNYRLMSGASAVMMMPIPRHGRLQRVTGLDAARSVNGIEDVVLTAAIGDTLIPLPEGDRYLGFIFARAVDAAGAQRALAIAHAKIRFDIYAAGVQHAPRCVQSGAGTSATAATDRATANS